MSVVALLSLSLSLSLALAALMAVGWLVAWLEELGHWDNDPVTCECIVPVPDVIDECQRCHRLVLDSDRGLQ